MVRILASVALLLGVSGSSFAEDPRDPIDLVLDDCFGGEGPNDVQLLECFAVARRSWDEALNVALADVLGKLDQDSRALFEASQRQWVAFREAETAFWRNWKAIDDIDRETNVEAALVDIVRARTLYLRAHSASFYLE
jgi:uncharacterized protein YecT (DUF1311 family)